ncbi:hypothetical protein GEV33_015001 [Tenebrio molitor]|uniref:Uncharacterized protein n=1 Tax=Tenebrio molitor TaxID=7067 RepID=A0A8J6GX81_TENMO|nr:hypothetical protein GEV33_015001 [Tenebrio molitor]
MHIHRIQIHQIHIHQIHIHNLHIHNIHRHINFHKCEIEIKKASSTCRNGHFRKLAPWDPELFSYPYLEMVPETGDESSIILREHYDASAFDDLKKGSSILDVIFFAAEDHAREKRSVIRDFVENVADIFVPTDPPPPPIPRRIINNHNMDNTGHMDNMDNIRTDTDFHKCLPENHLKDNRPLFKDVVKNVGDNNYHYLYQQPQQNVQNLQFYIHITVPIVVTMKALFSVTILFFVFSLIEGLPTPENHPIAKREVLRDFVSNVADIFVPTDPPPPDIHIPKDIHIRQDITNNHMSNIQSDIHFLKCKCVVRAKQAIINAHIFPVNLNDAVPIEKDETDASSIAKDSAPKRLDIGGWVQNPISYGTQPNIFNQHPYNNEDVKHYSSSYITGPGASAVNLIPSSVDSYQMVINQPQTIETIRGYQYVNEPPVTMMQQQPGYDFYQVETDRPTNNLFGSGYQMVNDKSPNLETYGQAQIVEQFPSSVYVENVPSTFTSDKRPTVTAQQVPNSGTVHIETDPSSLNLYQLPSENGEVNIAENTYVQSIGVSNIPYPGVIKRVPVTIVTPGHVYVLFTPNGTQVLTNNFQNTGGHFIPATDAQQVDPNTYGLYDPSNHYIVQQQLGQNQVLYNQYPYFQPGMIHQFIRPDGPGLQQFPSNTQYIGQNPSDFNPIQQQPGYYQPFPNQYPNFEPGMNQYVRPDNPGFPPTPLISPGFEKPEYPDLGNIISLKFDTTKSYEELCLQISNFIKRINAKATIYLKVSDGQYLGRIRGTILIHNFEHSYLNKQQIILLAKQTICVDGSIILTMVHNIGGKIERITVITPTATEELRVPEESTPVDTVSTTEKSKDNQSTTNVATEKSTKAPVTAVPTFVDTASTTEKVKGDNPQLLFPIDNEQFQDTSSKSFLAKIIQKGIQFVFGFGKTFSKNSLKPSTPLNISPGFEKPEYEDLGNTISLEFDTTKSYEELCLEIIDFIQRVNAQATIYLKVNNGQYLGRIRDGSLILTTKHNINGEIEKITVITPSTMEVFMVPDEPTSVDPVSTTEKAKDDQSTTVTAEKSKETPVTAVPTSVDTVSTTEAVKGDDPQSTTVPTEKSTETPVTAVKIPKVLLFPPKNLRKHLLLQYQRLFTLFPQL